MATISKSVVNESDLRPGDVDWKKLESSHERYRQSIGRKYTSRIIEQMNDRDPELLFNSLGDIGIGPENIKQVGQSTEIVKPGGKLLLPPA